jgi:hypothetical protein
MQQDLSLKLVIAIQTALADSRYEVPTPTYTSIRIDPNRLPAEPT